MTRRFVIGAATCALVLAACDAGTMSSDQIYREYPAAEAPMLYAPSRIRALDDQIASHAPAPARARSIEIEPQEVRAKLLGTDEAIVEVRFKEGAWTSETEKASFITRDQLAKEGSFAVADAHLAELPQRLKTLLAPLFADGTLAVNARVVAVNVRAGEGGVETEIELSDVDQEMRIVVDGSGKVLRRSVKKDR